MSTIDFDKFDLDGLSLEGMETEKIEEPKSNKKLEPTNTIAKPTTENNENLSDEGTEQEQEQEQDVELVVESKQAENDEEQMTCPKCELLQIKAEQCSGCGVYVKKALAQIGQSNIQITATKF